MLDGVSLDVAAGQLVHVSGPNGSGKTTLLRVCSGLLPAEQGSVIWGGQSGAPDPEAVAAEFCYLGHSDALKADLTARENLRYAVGLRRQVTATAIDETLAQVGLSGCRELQARVLSAGQKRRLAIARVTLSAAPLWILDEPFTNLDHAAVLLVSEVIADHLDCGGATLLATHQSPVIPRHAAIRVELR